MDRDSEVVDRGPVEDTWNFPLKLVKQNGFMDRRLGPRNTGLLGPPWSLEVQDGDVEVQTVRSVL